MIARLVKSGVRIGLRTPLCSNLRDCLEAIETLFRKFMDFSQLNLLTFNKIVYYVYNVLLVCTGGDFVKEKTVSARLDPETAKKLELLVKATARSRSYLVAEAIESYVKDQTWQIEAIKEGIIEADKGKFAAESQVKKTFQKWGVNEG